MVLNDIIDQVSERPMSKATHLSSAFQVLITLTIIMTKDTFMVTMIQFVMSVLIYLYMPTMVTMPLVTMWGLW